MMTRHIYCYSIKLCSKTQLRNETNITFCGRQYLTHEPIWEAVPGVQLRVDYNSQTTNRRHKYDTQYRIAVCVGSARGHS